MHLRHLSLVDFRNHEQTELPLEPGTTTLCGGNGHGKTNIVEAVGYIATLSSHRVAHDAPLVRHGTERALVRAAVVRDGRETRVDLEIVAGRANKARVGGAPVPRPRDILGVLRTVLFAPEDLAVVKGDPSTRRDFLDAVLIARQPRWAAVQGDYDKIVRQRNALLKNRRRDRRPRSPAPPLSTDLSTGLSTSVSTSQLSDLSPDAGGAISTGFSTGMTGVDASVTDLDVWTDQLVTIGAQLTYARLRLLRDLVPDVRAAYAAFGEPADRVEVTYRLAGADEPIDLSVEVPDVAVLRERLVDTARERAAAEHDRGQTLVGPHRDEVSLTLAGMPARGYASHGESWSLALALRLGSFALLRRDLATDPVLLLDDVFAELDARRRARLVDAVADAEQVLVTAAVEDDVPPGLASRRVRVSNGRIVEA